MEKIYELVKIFLEKNYIYTLIAILCTFIIFYITPPDFKVLIKFGRLGYIVFIFIVVFLIINFIVYIYEKVSGSITYNKLKKEQLKETEKESLKLLWNKVDSLSPYEYKLLKYFLETNNVPIIISGYMMGHKLLNEYWCNSKEIEIDNNDSKTFDLIELKEKYKISKGAIARKYALKQEIFEILKYSTEKYGKISNIE